MVEQKITSQEIPTRLSTIFYGREKELQKLHHLFGKMLRGSGSFAVITGEAGIGKTALVRQFVEKVRNEKIRFISETFKNVAIYEPYAPFLKIVAKLGGANMLDLMKKVGKVVNGENSTGNEMLSNPSWNMESLYSLQTERGLAQQQLAINLLSASKEKPLILVLSDVHLASLSAWQFIHYLSQSVIDHPIMILVTLRQDGREVKQDKVPVYAEVLHRMQQENLVERIALTRFSKAEVRRYLREIFIYTDFSQQLLPLLFEVSMGVVQQLSSLLQTMVDYKLIFEQDGIWFNQENMTKEKLVYLLRQDIDLEELSNFIQNLEILQKTLLEYSALFDSRIDHLILAAVLKLLPVKVLDELKFFLDKKILIALSEGEFQFKIPTIQTFLLERINPKSSKLLHLEIAKSIEKAEHLENSKKVFMLAFHYSKAQNLNQAIDYLSQAGDLALKNLAFPEARDYFRQASTLLIDNLLQFTEVKNIGMLVEAAWIERNMGDRKQSLKLCQIARDLINDRTDSSIHGQILVNEGFNYLKLNNWERAKQKFNQCLDVKTNLNEFNRSLVNFGLGTVFFELSEYHMAKKYFKASLQIAVHLNSDKLIATTLNHLGALENVQGNSTKAISLYSKSIPLFQRIGDRAGLAQIYHNIGMSYGEGKRWKKANEFFGKSLAISDRMGLVPLKSITFLNRALALAYLSKFEEAEEYNFKAQRLLHQLNDELGLAEYYKIQGIIFREKGELNRADIEFKTAINKYEEFSNKLGRAETEHELARLAKITGDSTNQNYWLNKCLKSYKEMDLLSKVNSIKREFTEIKKNELEEIAEL